MVRLQEMPPKPLLDGSIVLPLRRLCLGCAISLLHGIITTTITTTIKLILTVEQRI